MDFVIYLAISVILMFASTLLIRRPKMPARDDQPTTLTSRGEHVPYVIGLRSTGYLFGHAWDRYSKKEGGSSGWLGIGKTPGTKIYYEYGWHQIGLGPAKTLYRIEDNGEVIFEGPISAEDTPSGSLIETPENGSFRIYWGQQDQPASVELQKSLGIGSRWPGLFHVVWEAKKVGPSPMWGQLQYVWEAECPGNTLLESSYVIEEYGSAYVKGINHAHALYQLLTAHPPYGCGMEPGLIDRNTLEATGVLMEEEGIALNMLLEPGRELKENLQFILLDMGVMIPQQGSHLLFLPQRYVEDSEIPYIPVLTDDLISPPDTTRRIDRTQEATSRAVFTFMNQRDEQYEFRTYDIAFDDDSLTSLTGGMKDDRVLMETVTHAVHASRVAQRREQELSLNNSTRFKGLRATRQMLPGQVFFRDGEMYRTSSIKPSFDSPQVEIEASIDSYGVDALPDLDAPGMPIVEPLDAEVDVAFAWFELPEDMVSNRTIIVFRTRAHAFMEGSRILVRSDESVYPYEDGSFFEISNQDTAAAGGLIESAIPVEYPEEDIIEDGPIFEDENGDAADVPDLSTDTAAWEAGWTLARINDEIFYLRSVELQAESDWTASTAYSVGDSVIPLDASPTGLRYVCIGAGTSDSEEPEWGTQKGDVVADGGVTWEARHFAYQMKGLIRSRFGTDQEAHAVDDRVFIIRQDDLVALTTPLLTAGAEICVKSIPFKGAQVVDPADVGEVCGTLSA